MYFREVKIHELRFSSSVKHLTSLTSLTLTCGGLLLYTRQLAPLTVSRMIIVSKPTPRYNVASVSSRKVQRSHFGQKAGRRLPCLGLGAVCLHPMLPQLFLPYPLQFIRRNSLQQGWAIVLVRGLICGSGGLK
jgi:hypothetical protein